MTANRVGNRSRRQRDERRLHILRFRVDTRGAHPLLEPLEAELVAMRALRRWRREEGIGEQRVEQRGNHLARCRPCALRIEGRAAVARAPQIGERITGPRVEAAHRAVDGQIRHVGDATDVHDDAVAITPREQRRVERGHERRALPAGGDVAAAEIADDDHPRLLGNARGIVELNGDAEVGTVPQRLAVHAGRLHDVT